MELKEIREKAIPKTILVTINRREEEIDPRTSKEDPDGTYIQKESGVVS